MPRPVLYWSYEVTTRDAHEDLQRYTDFGFDTQAEAESECFDRARECEALGHNDVGYVIYPVYGAE
jgi:hypothetical protein